MSANRRPRIDYSPYIHQDSRGRYVVARWDDVHHNWLQPMNNAERKLTGCGGSWALTLEQLPGWRTRAQARYQARVRFGLGEG